MPESVSRRSSAVAIASRLTTMRITVRLFAGLRERAGGRRELELDDGARVADVWAALGLGDEPEGLLYAVNHEYASAARPRGRRRGRADPAGLGRRVPAHRGPDRPRRGRRRGRRRAGRRDRDVPRHDAGRVARPAGRATSSTRPTKAWPRRSWRRSPRQLRERYELCAIAITHRIGRLRDRRDERRDRRLRAPPRGRARRLQGGDRHAQGDVPLWKKEVYEGGEEWIGRGS